MTDRPMSDERISSMSQIEELVERLKGPMPNRAAAVQDMKGVNVIEFDWLKIEAERNEAAAALTTLLRERDEARAKALTGSVTLDHVKDLSKQGWAAIFDARQFLDLGTPADIEEAKQNIDLALPSFADAIMESENRAQAATARAESAEAQVETLKQVVADLGSGSVSNSPLP